MGTWAFSDYLVIAGANGNFIPALMAFAKSDRTALFETKMLVRSLSWDTQPIKTKIQRFTFSLLAMLGRFVASPYKADAPTVVTRAENLDEADDYVIIGGGTAGLTVADQLTADGKTTMFSD
jgi:hypothetical protein